MLQPDINCSPTSFNNLEPLQDWESLEKHLPEGREYLKGILISEGVSETSTPAAFINEELVVKLLRSPETPETIYWLLRYYLETGHATVLNTDRNQTMYLELDRIEKSIAVYVGATDAIFSINQEDKSRIYVMEIQEKYELLWCAAPGVVLKKRYSAESIQELASIANDREPASRPLLFFTTGERSACAMHTRTCEKPLKAPKFESTCRTQLDTYEEWLASQRANEQEINDWNLFLLAERRADNPAVRKVG